MQQLPGRRQQMINSSLQTFINKVHAAGRISFGDVKRLQRDILPDGISSREEAELLLTLALTVGRADRAFGDWLVAVIGGFCGLGPAPHRHRGCGDRSVARPVPGGPEDNRRCAASPGNSRPRRTTLAAACPPLPRTACQGKAHQPRSLRILCRWPLEMARHSSSTC